MADQSEHAQMERRTPSKEDGACMVILKQLRRSAPRMSEKNRRLLAIDIAIALTPNWLFHKHIRVEEVMRLPKEDQ